MRKPKCELDLAMVSRILFIKFTASVGAVNLFHFLVAAFDLVLCLKFSVPLCWSVSLFIADG